MWERQLSFPNVDIRGQRLDSAGASVGGVISIESNAATVAVRPRVANINGPNMFVVVYSYGGDVFARGVSATTGTVTLTAEVGIATGNSNQIDPDIGGEAMGFASGTAVAVWNEGVQIATRTIGVAAGALVLGATWSVSTGSGQEPSISNSGGEAGHWLIAWTSNGAPDIVVGRVWSRSGTFLTITTILAIAAQECTQPAVDGDGTNWVVAYARGEASGLDTDIYAVPVWRSGNVLSVGVSVAVESGVGDDERQPCVAWLGNSVLVGWEDEVTSNNYDTYVTSIDPFGCGPCEDDFSLGVTAQQETAVSIGTRFAGGEFFSRDALVQWQSVELSTGRRDFLFQRFRASHGAYTDLGGRCDAGGIAQATCAGSPHPAFRVRLRGAPAGAAVVGIIGFSTLNYGCGSCLVVPDPYTGLVWTQTADSFGNTQLNFPILPGAAGAEFYLQFLHLVPPPTPCSIDFNSSNALRVGIETL